MGRGGDDWRRRDGTSRRGGGFHDINQGWALEPHRAGWEPHCVALGKTRHLSEPLLLRPVGSLFCRVTGKRSELRSIKYPECALSTHACIGFIVICKGEKEDLYTHPETKASMPQPHLVAKDKALEDGTQSSVFPPLGSCPTGPKGPRVWVPTFCSRLPLGLLVQERVPRGPCQTPRARSRAAKRCSGVAKLALHLEASCQGRRHPAGMESP